MLLSDASKRFLIAYGVWLAVLFGLFYLNTNPLSHWLNEWQRGTLLEMLRYFLGADRIRGIRIIAHPKFHIIITQACNGFIPYYLYLAGVFAYPYYRWSWRILWAVIGYGIISAVNVARLLFVTAMTGHSPGNFHWSHDLVGNFLLMVTGLGLFWLYIRLAPRRVQIGYNSPTNAE